MYTISDSISLKIINDNNVLAGVGNEIRLHTKDDSSTLPFKLKGKVHGIESEEWTNKLLIYGENEFIFIEQNALNFELLYRGCLSDWVSSGKLLKEEGSFLLVTSHSVAVLLKYNDVTHFCEIQNKISCTDKSTLYSSYIYGTSWEDLLILGGNAFGELLVWQPTIQCEENSGRAKLLQRRPCHNGVIFSIDIDMEAKMLVTTSDDRSVRFWDILLSAESDDFNKAKIVNPKSGYSHVARVFKAKIIRECGEIYVLTGGEDSFFCLWNRKGELLFKRRQQFGATIWNLDYHSPTKTILTVGSSGNILKYGLEDCLKQDADHLPIILTAGQSLEENEYIAKIKFLNETNFIAMTNKNRLMHRHHEVDGDDGDGRKGEWIIVNSFVPCKCTVLEVYNDMIAIAGYQKVTLYNFMETNSTFEKMFEGKVLPGVIRSFIFLSQSEYLVSDESGNCKLIRSHNFEDSVSIDLPQCKERWITAACKVDSEFLIVSNRQGSLMLYSTSVDDQTSKPCDTIKRLHGHLGCTTVTLLRDYTSFSILKTTGHDYAVKTIKLDKKDKTISVLSREIIPIAWVEKIIPSHNNNELLFGFNDNHFVLWSREIETHFEIPCGGGHRCWDLHIEPSKNLVRTVFIKNKQVLLHQKIIFNESTFTLNIPKNNWHVKPCNVLSCHKSNELFLVSGGEDNMLKVSKFNSESGTLTQLHSIYSHISSIRGLCVAWNATARKHVIFSCGGRAQICVSAFEEGSEFVEELIDYTIQNQVKSQDIRCDPETRVMSIDVRLRQEEENCFDIFVGCSDGYVRRLKMEKSSISQVSEVFYGKCILHVRIAGPYLLSVGTDGVVCFWNINNFEVDFKIAHHESGVNSFDVRVINQNEFHLITGGDDQDVVYSKINYNSGTFDVITLKRMNYLHTAQVTAVKFTPCMNYFYSSSIDQVVRKVNLETFDSNWEMVSCVADVKGIELVEESENLRAFVYGCGLQVI
ncbi:WD repeat-containing protein 6 [Eupeodes corollae]|uniref:WD repeat-containing protein 6 n=1 Tax=Eupeodes corollae TaxID=290404 RepID=UPI002493934C|nr:WD repeat-containing protein 6 [Eupeodes corollae]